MKTLILYHSFTGKTKKLALQKAAELGADIEEITGEKKPCKFKAFTVGIIKALGRKKAKIKPIQSELNRYDQIIIMTPIWAGHPTPVFNSIIALVPSGKKLELIFVSQSGATKESAEGTKALVTSRGCELTGYTDVKG